MTDNINKNKNQHNYAIEHEPKFDNKLILSISNKYPLLVITFILRVGHKQRTTIVDCLTYMWYIGATYSTIKIKHAKNYERIMQSNKL